MLILGFSALPLRLSNIHSIHPTYFPYMQWWLPHASAGIYCMPHVSAGIYCTPLLFYSGNFTYSGWKVCAWKITSHVEIISIAFRGYVNLIFICINFQLMMFKEYALLSWRSSLNLLYSCVKRLLVQCHLLEQLFFSHTSAKKCSETVSYSGE